MYDNLLAQLNRTWASEPVFFEDALGRRFPIHLEFINSIEAFHGALSANFIGLPGEKKVARKEYALEDAQSRREIQLSGESWRYNFWPGRRINMSIVFRPREVFFSQGGLCCGWAPNMVPLIW
jgi:hypothetical protein